MSHPRSPMLVTGLVAGAFFMENLDGTIIATALPQMAHSLRVSAVSLNVGMTAYLLTLAVMIPVSGWIADRFGARSVFAAAISIFTVASVLCGLSHTLTQFTCMRVLQGMGGAMMVPVGRLIILRETPKDKLTQAIGYITWPGLTALVLGPPLGGFITSYASWHWIFFLNLPLGIVALVLSLLWIHNDRLEEPQDFDWFTFVLAGIASAGMVLALEKLGGDSTGGRLFAVLTLIGSAVCGLGALFLARHRRETSFIDLASMRLATYSLSVFGGSAFRIAVSVLPFLLPLMFQISFGVSAFTSGLYLLALFAGDLSMKAFVIPVLRRFGFRRILIVNGVITAASIAVCALLTPSTPVVVTVGILAFHGACRSLEFTCLTTLAYTEVTPERMSRANAFLSSVMQLSLTLGVAVGSLTLRGVALAHGHSANQPQLRDFHIAIATIALLALGPVIDSLRLSPDAGAGTSGHRTVPEPIAAN